MKQIVDKKVKLTLVGLNGNAFALMGAWQAQAKREKWTPAEMKAVLDEAMSSDYNHLIATLDSHCETPDEEDDEEEEYLDGEIDE